MSKGMCIFSYNSRYSIDINFCEESFGYYKKRELHSSDGNLLISLIDIFDKNGRYAFSVEKGEEQYNEVMFSIESWSEGE